MAEPAADTTGSRRLVLASLLFVMAAGAALLSFVAVAPNRIVSGKPVALHAAAGPLELAVIGLAFATLVAIAAAPRSARFDAAAVAAAALLLLATLVAAGHSAAQVAAGSTSARTSLGGAFWIIALGASLIIADGLTRLRAAAGTRLLVALALAAAVTGFGLAGSFDALAIVREWSNRREAFLTAILDHVSLVASALVPALVIGFLLGLLALRREAARGPLFATLNLIQTIPSIALFGLLIGPLTLLADALPALRTFGVSGIGRTPALIALVLYALLPVTRSVVTGFSAVPEGSVEAGRGMGMTPLQLFVSVELPLALPVLLSGLRVVIIQLIGLTVVAALIGAGGLGSFVFLGLGQTANDLVLLGALTTIAMALVTDAALRTLTGLAQRTGTA